jgi:4-hydroxythreonine-4-phosphate dehydrogenase
VIDKLEILEESLKQDFGIEKPKIAVLGVNPHAGDEGLLGSEEQQLIGPLIEEQKNRGKLVFGPFPADGFFGSKTYLKYDAVLAMYHDQGLVPFKSLSFGSGVNYTAGLPVIRTSPDHGTAYPIAGKGVADESSFRAALFTNLDLIRHRKGIAESA